MRVARKLSPRQAEVLTLARDGLPRKAIARTMGLAETTVKNYYHRIERRLGAENITQTVVIAIRCKFIPLKGDINGQSTSDNVR